MRGGVVLILVVVFLTTSEIFALERGSSSLSCFESMIQTRFSKVMC